MTYYELKSICRMHEFKLATRYLRVRYSHTESHDTPTFQHLYILSWILMQTLAL